MKRSWVLALLIALAGGLGAVVALRATARERQYRELLARGEAALVAADESGREQTYGAIEAYSGAIALRPDSMLPLLRRGEAYQRRGELDAAARDFQQASIVDPTATRPLEELGDLKYGQQRFQRAAEAYERYLRLDERAARVSYKLALAYYRDGNLTRALGAVVSTLKVNDRLADAYYLQGLCFRDQRRQADARRAFERALAISPGLIPAREELADLFGAAGRHAEELEQLQVLAGLDREHGERQVAVGLAQERWSNDPQESAASRARHSDLAVLTLSGALDRAPDQPLIYTALGRVWLEIAEAREDPVALNKALEALRRAGSDAAATSEALTLYARALMQSGRIEPAERALGQAIERYPVEPAALLHYANAAERQNQPASARQALLQYGALVRDAPSADFSQRAARIAALSARMNDLVTAEEWLRRAVSASPHDDELAGQLAAVVNRQSIGATSDPSDHAAHPRRN